MTRFEWDPSTIKVDWALDGPIPWAAPEAAQAGTVHIADDLDHLTAWSAEIQRGAIPQRPFLVMGQYAAMDPTRMPAGKEIAYAYTHLPQGSWTPELTDSLVDSMQAEIEQRAPGFGKLVRARHVLTPEDLEARDANLVGGALNGGTAQLHQQLIFRPIPGNGRSATPIRGVYLASASAHPGGGVHGAAGTNAARAALAATRPPRRVGLRGGAGAQLAVAESVRRSHRRLRRRSASALRSAIRRSSSRPSTRRNHPPIGDSVIVSFVPVGLRDEIQRDARNDNRPRPHLEDQPPRLIALEHLGRVLEAHVRHALRVMKPRAGRWPGGVGVADVARTDDPVRVQIGDRQRREDIPWGSRDVDAIDCRHVGLTRARTDPRQRQAEARIRAPW